MSIKLKRIFEREYGKKKGDRIFYAYENKRKPKLILTGKPSYVKHMFLHLRKEHPSTKHRMKLI